MTFIFVLTRISGQLNICGRKNGVIINPFSLNGEAYYDMKGIFIRFKQINNLYRFKSMAN